ncbi:MAG: TolC family outer membrane protein [Pseudomonadota bacterium]
MTNSRFRAALAGAALTVFACIAAPQAGAEDLLDIYQRALQSDPQIREAEANLLANSELRPQARGLLFPQINASGSETRSENSGVQVFPQAVSPTEVIQVTSEFETRDIESTFWQVELRQTVFRWDQFIGLQQADKRVAEAEANYEGAQQGLMLRVAERYFDVLAAEDSLEASEANKTAIAKQLDQAQKRFEVGLIAITDVQESQAAFDQAVADEIAAKRALANAKNLLSEIVGGGTSDLAKPGETVPLTPPTPADEEQWVQQALEQNLDLIASRISSDIASKEVSSRRSSYMPTLDLVVSRSSNESESERQNNNAGGFFPQSSSNEQDSITLQVNVPIFAGGANSSRVREAVYLHRAARERAQRIARETERLARDSYLGVLAEISRTKALEQALKSSEVALEATQAGFEVGTRTTVDVLDAQRQLFNARTQYLRARYDYLLNVLRLKQASGALQVQDLERINSLLEG